ncbi:hypothetical protein [Modestobacter lacusdianchii]
MLLPLHAVRRTRSKITSRHTWCIQAERIRCDEKCASIGRLVGRERAGVTSVASTTRTTPVRSLGGSVHRLSGHALGRCRLPLPDED